MNFLFPRYCIVLNSNYLCFYVMLIFLIYIYFVANLSLSEIRRMYFKLKNEVFMQKIGDVVLPDSQTEIL